MCRLVRTNRREKLSISSQITTKKPEKWLTKWDLNSSLSSDLNQYTQVLEGLTANPARLVSLSTPQHPVKANAMIDLQ